jgi:NAD+ kinase
VADPVDAAACDLLLAVGGDGTALSALHTGTPSRRPVLGVACGSIGALTSVSAERVGWALQQIATGRWTPVAVPGLDVAWGEGPGGVAINDVAIVRGGSGQIMVSITVDEVLYARIAGDGLVVATALGSSAYTMAAGGPILAPGVEGMALTPLAVHGGSCPLLVAGTASRVRLEIEPGYGGVRYELDGRQTGIEATVLTVRHRQDYATLVTLADEEPRITGLRRRGLADRSSCSGASAERVLCKSERVSRDGPSASFEGEYGAGRRRPARRRGTRSLARGALLPLHHRRGRDRAPRRYTPSTVAARGGLGRDQPC